MCPPSVSLISQIEIGTVFPLLNCFHFDIAYVCYFSIRLVCALMYWCVIYSNTNTQNKNGFLKLAVMNWCVDVYVLNTVQADILLKLDYRQKQWFHSLKALSSPHESASVSLPSPWGCVEGHCRISGVFQLMDKDLTLHVGLWRSP